MNILFFNGSPKSKGSTSGHLLSQLEKNLSALGSYRFAQIFSATATGESLAAALRASDALVMAFPLYVDSLPGHLLSILDQAAHPLALEHTCKKVYTLVNCGFFEGEQGHIALKMVDLWCQDAGLAFGGGISFGAGGMLRLISGGQGPGKPVGVALNQLALALHSGTVMPPIFVNPKFPRFLYQEAVHQGWYKKGKKNGLKRGDLYKKHI